MKFINAIIILCFVFNTAIALDNAIKSTKDALTKANQYFGIGEIDGYSRSENVSAELVVNNDDKTPYLHRWINGNKVWKIVYLDVPYYKTLDLFSFEEEIYITFDILIDYKSGRLLKIWSRIKDTSAIVRRAPDIDVYEAKLFRNFEGLPDVEPYPFFEVLKQGKIDITKSIEFEAVYILQTIRDTSTIPYWHITLHDFSHPVSSPSGKTGMASYTCDHTFNGKTGEHLSRQCGGKPIKRDQKPK
ncbi:MAG: hypothetical protein GY865_05630 [candidate division Zixibacteria bacterium]|nr:hypothetical protein [candidate division Zixibacteria bacterium]